MVRRSAPGIAGMWTRNPSWQIRSGDAMSEQLGEMAPGDAIATAVATMPRDGVPWTRGRGVQAGTVDVGQAVAQAVWRG